MFLGTLASQKQLHKGLFAKIIERTTHTKAACFACLIFEGFCGAFWVSNGYIENKIMSSFSKLKNSVRIMLYK